MEIHTLFFFCASKVSSIKKKKQQQQKTKQKTAQIFKCVSLEQVKPRSSTQTKCPLLQSHNKTLPLYQTTDNNMPLKNT
jgi:hypothetical protein